VIPSDSESTPPVRRRGRRPRTPGLQDASPTAVTEAPESPSDAHTYLLPVAPIDAVGEVVDAPPPAEDGEPSVDPSSPARRRSRGRGRGRGRQEAGAGEAAAIETPVFADQPEALTSEPTAEPEPTNEAESAFVPLTGFDVPSLPAREFSNDVDEEVDEDEEIAPPPAPPTFPAGRFQPRAPRGRSFPPPPPPVIQTAFEDAGDAADDLLANEPQGERFIPVEPIVAVESVEAVEPVAPPTRRGRAAAPVSTVTVDVTIPRGYARRISAKLIRQVIEKAIAKEALPQPVTVDVVMVTDDEMREINVSHRGIDEATDVLSFPLLDLKPGEGVTQDFFLLPPDVSQHLGDVVISVPRVESQAEEAGHSPERELAFLTVHGILHILGYDHDTDDKRRQMRRREEEILGELGLRRNGNQ